MSRISASTGTSSPVESGTESAGGIIPGMKVVHERFGEGKVLQVEGNEKATVFFNGAGQKQLLLKFAKLRIIE